MKNTTDDLGAYFTLKGYANGGLVHTSLIDKRRMKIGIKIAETKLMELFPGMDLRIVCGDVVKDIKSKFVGDRPPIQIHKGRR